MKVIVVVVDPSRVQVSRPDILLTAADGTRRLALAAAPTGRRSPYAGG